MQALTVKVAPGRAPRPRCASEDPRVPPIPGEQWVAAPGWEGFYEVSDHGRIWSAPRPTTSGGLMAQVRIGRSRDHLGVRLCMPGKRAMVPVHSLVGLAFLGPTPPGMVVRHGSGGQVDNRAANLAHGTHVENQRDRIRDGTDIRGEQIPWSKLTESAVAECRRRHALGESQSALAREFKVGKSVMNRAIHRKTWAHVA